MTIHTPIAESVERDDHVEGTCERCNRQSKQLFVATTYGDGWPHDEHSCWFCLTKHEKWLERFDGRERD